MFRQLDFALQMRQAEAGETGTTGDINQITGLSAITTQSLAGCNFTEGGYAQIKWAARGVATDPAQPYGATLAWPNWTRPWRPACPGPTGC